MLENTLKLTTTNTHHIQMAVSTDSTKSDIEYWICRFSNYTFIKWRIYPGQTIEKAIERYLHSQNVGEAKSDRMHLYDKKLVTPFEFGLSSSHERQY
jgi:hypothetical protein